MYKYLTTEPIPPHVTTPITNQQGNVIAEWVSTNLRPAVEAAEIEEAVRWSTRTQSKWMEWRRGDENTNPENR